MVRNTEEQIKVLKSWHIIAINPVICDDCKKASDDYFKITFMEAGKKRSKRVCENCIMHSRKYKKNDEFYSIDEIEPDPVFGRY